MKITEIKTVVVNAHMRNWIFVKVETDVPGLHGWGEATIFKVEIDVNEVPALELQIAGNGKLIRIDHLRVEKDDNDNGDNTSE